MKKTKTAFIWVLLVVAIALALWLKRSNEPENTVSYGEFLASVTNGELAKLEVNGQQITFTDRDGFRYQTNGPLVPTLYKQLSEQGVPIVYGPERSGSMITWISFALPVVLLVAFLIYFLRKSKGDVGNVLSLRKSPHREVTGTESRVTFADVGGCEEAKQLLGDVIDFLNHPQRWVQAGVRLPRGILLEGPPGCGKTLLARAVAGETKAKFFLVSGSDFVEMFVGVGAARVRDMFETAMKQAPAVIFIDELDALGRRRGSGIGSSHDEREQTLNQLLVSLDGFKSNDRVVVLAATNRPDVLDQALVRPGRIDRRILIPELTEQARVEVLKIHTRSKPLDATVDVSDVARRTSGFNGAQLENLTNEAALLAVRRVRNQTDGLVRVTLADFLHAMEPGQAQDRRFNRLDSILIESASQLAEPTGTARVRLVIRDAPVIEGEVVWADAGFLKIRRANGEPDVVVAKRQVQQLEVLDGTGAVRPDEIQIDAWALRPSGSA